MPASTVPTGWPAKSFQSGTAAWKASQPGPCGSGTGVLGFGSGSAAAVPVRSGETAIATAPAAPTARRHALPEPIFTMRSFISVPGTIRCRDHPTAQSRGAHPRLPGCAGHRNLVSGTGRRRDYGQTHETSPPGADPQTTVRGGGGAGAAHRVLGAPATGGDRFGAR